MQENLTKLLSDLDLGGVKFELDDEITVNKPVSNLGIPVATQSNVSYGTTAAAKSESKITSSNLSVADTNIPISKPISNSALEAEAQSLAKSADSISELVKLIKDFKSQPTAKLAKNIIPPVFGNDSKLLIVIDAPGKEDDEIGEVISGSARELLVKMLKAIDLDIENVSIFPSVFHKLPGDRTPTAEELSISRVFFIKFLEFLKPRKIMTFGQTALNLAMPATGNLPKVQGDELDFDNGGELVKLIPTYGIKTLILKPEFKRDTWEALQKV